MTPKAPSVRVQLVEFSTVFAVDWLRSEGFCGCDSMAPPVVVRDPHYGSGDNPCSPWASQYPLGILNGAEIAFLAVSLINFLSQEWFNV
jgi:hypothetical protein